MATLGYVLDIETVGVGDCADYLDPPSAPANYKDPDKIAAYVAEAAATQVRRAALDPDLCRVVAIGYRPMEAEASTVLLCDSEPDETIQLRRLWKMLGTQRTVTFHGFGFDLPVLLRRSQLLGVPAPDISLDRYRSPHVDLLQRLTFNGAIAAHSLTFYAKRFNLPGAGADPVSGKDIDRLVTAGDWAAVEAHCRADVDLTHALALRLGCIPTLEPDREAWTKVPS